MAIVNGHSLIVKKRGCKHFAMKGDTKPVPVGGGACRRGQKRGMRRERGGPTGQMLGEESEPPIER